VYWSEINEQTKTLNVWVPKIRQLGVLRCGRGGVHIKNGEQGRLMPQLIYILHFRGTASRSGENSTVLRATSSGTSCTITSIIRAAGLETTIKAAEGDLAFLESELQITAPDSLTGRGTLTFGDESEHSMRLLTVGRGHFGPTTEPGIVAGTVSWRVDGGMGQFAAATGFIASTFTLNDAGEVSEYQCGLIFLPG
jgi:hypothetical protein